MLRKLTVLALLLTFLTSPSFGQEEPDKDDEASALERLIYVPYRKLRDVFDKQDASVVVPYAEYLKMLERMMQPRAGKPLDAVITKAEYKATVEGDVARVNAQLSVLITGKPWVRVPVSFGEAAIGKIESDNGKVLLQGTGNGKYQLLFSEAGEHTVKMELVARVLTSPQGRSLQLSVPRVGITNFELTVPRADQSVSITPKQVVQKVDGDDDATTIKANVGSTNGIVARWTPQASAKPEMDLLTSVQNNLQVLIDEGLIHRTARMKFDVLRGEMSELTFVVPIGDRLLDVTSDANQVRKWTTKKEDNRQVVTVQLLAPTEDDVELEVRTEQTLGDGEVRVGGIADDGTVHGIHAQEVVRESGVIQVTYSPELALNVVRQERVTRTSQGTGNFLWRFYGSNMDVAVTASKIEPRVIANQAAYYTITDDNELKLRSQFNYSIERAGVFELTINVPEGLTIDNVRGGNVTDFNVADGKLTVTLSAKKMGNTSILVTGHVDFADAMEDAKAFPFLQATAVERETGMITIMAPPAIEVVTDDDSVSGLFPSDLPVQSGYGQGGQGIPRNRTVSTWTYNKAPIAMSASLNRKPPRLVAFANTNINVLPKVITVCSQLQFDVANAGVDTFRFAVPEAFGDSIRVTAAGGAIKQQTRVDAEDGWVTWTVVMQQKTEGTTTLTVEYDLTTIDEAADAAAADDDAPAPVESEVKPIRILAAGPDSEIEPVEINGEVAISKDQSLSVSAEAEGDNVETIDVRELRLPNTDANLAYRYFEQDVQVKLSAVKYAIKSVVETVVSRAAVEVQLGHDPVATYLCRYRIKSSERQRLRVDLPADAELLDQLVNDTRISLTPVDEGVNIEGWESFYANLGSAVSGSGANKTFRLTLHFRAPITAPETEPFAQFRASRQKIRLPRIGGQADDVVVQQLRTAVWLPNDYALVGQPDKYARGYESWLGNSWPLRLVRRSGHKQLDQWIGTKNTGLVDFPREGHSYVYTSLGRTDDITVTWWDMPFWMWVISGAIFLIGFVLRKTPWENKLTIILIVAFIAVLYALRDQETVMQSLYAGSYGIVAVLILWIIYTLRGRLNAPTAGTGSSGSTPPPTPTDPGPPPKPVPASAIAVSPPPGAVDQMNKLMGGGK